MIQGCGTLSQRKHNFICPWKKELDVISAQRAEKPPMLTQFEVQNRGGLKYKHVEIIMIKQIGLE